MVSGGGPCTDGLSEDQPLKLSPRKRRSQRVRRGTFRKVSLVLSGEWPAEDGGEAGDRSAPIAVQVTEDGGRSQDDSHAMCLEDGAVRAC